MMSRTETRGGRYTVSFQPASCGGGVAPPMSSSWNCTPWTWKLCGTRSWLLTSQTSVVSLPTTSSIRSMSMLLSLICPPASRNARVVAAAAGASRGAWTSCARRGPGGRQRGGGAQLQHVEGVPAAGDLRHPAEGTQLRRERPQDHLLAGLH